MRVWLAPAPRRGGQDLGPGARPERRRPGQAARRRVPRGAGTALGARRRHRLLGLAQGEGPPGAIRRSRQGALDRLSLRDGRDARAAHARRSRTASEVRDVPLVILAATAYVIAAIVWLSRGPPSRLAYPRGARQRHRDHRPRQLLRRAGDALPDPLHVDRAVRVLLLPASRGGGPDGVPRRLVRGRARGPGRGHGRRPLAARGRHAARRRPPDLAAARRAFSARRGSADQSEERMRLVLDTAPDAFITLDSDGRIITWNAAAARLFGWSEEEAIGRTMRELIVPPEHRERHDERRQALIDTDDPDVPRSSFEVEFQRRDGSRFPGEATVSKLEGERRGVRVRLHHGRDGAAATRGGARGAVREQAARAEAERVAELVGGMQALVDAALAQRSLDGILRDLVAQVRGVLDAGQATIYLTERATTGSRSGPRRPAGTRGARRSPRRVAATRDAILAREVDCQAVIGVSAARRGRGHGRAGGGRRAAARVRWRGPHAAAARRGECRPRDRPCARVRARAPHRRDAAAQPPARPPARAARPGGGRALSSGRVRGGGGRRLVRRDPDRGRRRRAS